jgi:hypothetical protein
MADALHARTFFPSLLLIADLDLCINIGAKKKYASRHVFEEVMD